MSFKVLGDVSGDIFTNPNMTGIITICATCGRKFNRYPGHIYKKRHTVQGKVITDWYCRPSCWPADGLLNEGKYNDAKIRQQVQKSEKMHKEKYHESRKAYRLAHRKEISARQNARYNDGTPEAEAKRLERNRKAREKKQQKNIEKWKEEEQK